MFREAVFDVSHLLRTDGPNTLALCFHPPLQQLELSPFESWGRNPERAMMRKAQFGYGWDWGPRLPTIGIWRPVELCRQRYATMQGMHFSTLEIDTKRSDISPISRWGFPASLEVGYYEYIRRCSYTASTGISLSLSPRVGSQSGSHR